MRLSGVEIRGDLSCSGANLVNPDGRTLVAQRSIISGAVYLWESFASDGEVSLLGTKIGGSLRCDGGKFENPGGDAIDLEGTEVVGALHLHDLQTRPTGRVNLRRATVGELIDDRGSWPDQGQLVIDGFTYDHLAGLAPHSAKERLDWIGRQPADDFSLQPYEQLAKVLHSVGLEEDGRMVAIAKQRALRARLPRWRKPWSTFLDASIGYGYRPWRAVLWLLALWVVGSAYLHGIEVTDAMCATKASAFGGKACMAPPEYPVLVPAVYLIDTLLPFLDLHQEVYWEPDAKKPLGATLRAFQWVYIGLGWLFSILAAIGFSGILRKD